MGKKAFVKACVLACLMAVCPAHAETISGNSYQKIVGIASEFGEAKLFMPPDDDPYIKGKIDNVKYTVFFDDCAKHDDCKSLILRMAYANHGLALAEVNSFNAKTKVGKLFISDSNNLIFDYFVNLKHGVSEENLRSTFEWFTVGMRDVVRKIEGDESPDRIQSMGNRLKEWFRK
ncbi:MAG: YbjN domain-containing protein [Desulfovibrio desulfuricans]|jgi:hypothetical protein|nr:YbjN domain-containing protein [Desulfovibrio desulfuricans]